VGAGATRKPPCARASAAPRRRRCSPPTGGGPVRRQRVVAPGRGARLGGGRAGGGAPRLARAPGGAKRGSAHGARAGGGGWHVDDWDIDGALDAVAGLAGCYGSAAGACGGGGGGGETPPALLGLSVANEPDERIPPDVFLAFYRRAYAAVRAGGLRVETVAFVVDGNPFRADRLVAGGAIDRATRLRKDHLLVDVHSYQYFGGGWTTASVAEILRTWAPGGGGGGGGGGDGGGPPGERVAELAAAGTTLQKWILVGEWSLRLPWAGTGAAAELAAAGPAATGPALRAFGRAQVVGMDAAGVEGRCFWTWQVNTTAGEPWWDFCECVRRGWLDPAWWAGGQGGGIP